MGTKIYRKIILIWTILCMVGVPVLTGCSGEGADKTENVSGWEAVFATSMEKQMEVVERPECAAIGGEWTVISLARAGASAEKSYWEIYLTNLKKTLKECDGVLSDSKYTEYSRVILALTALGENPSDFDGYNLLAPLADFDGTVKQGINGAAYALIALDSGNYDIPETDAQTPATREKYVEWILSKEREEGGFSLSANADSSEADLTAMILQSLVPYQEVENVKAAVERGIETLSSLMDEEGYYVSYGERSCESTAQAVIALSALGIDCNKDERFVKNERGMVDTLLTYYDGEGGFAHTLGGDTDLMATEQALCALAAYERYTNNQNALYEMTDVQ